MRKRIVHQTEVVAEGEIEQKEDVFLKGDKVDILKWMAGLLDRRNGCNYWIVYKKIKLSNRFTGLCR